MAYSNINKDSRQASRSQKLKRVVLWGLLIIVTVSSLNNLYNQWNILRQASLRIEKMEGKVEILESEIRVLARQAEYATSSVGQARAARKYLGIGSENDYWIKVPIRKKSEMGENDKNTTLIKPNIMQWFDLITRHKFVIE